METFVEGGERGGWRGKREVVVYLKITWWGDT